MTDLPPCYRCHLQPCKCKDGITLVYSYRDIRDAVKKAGYGGERAWSESLVPCEFPDLFAREACWVILNSGMKEQVARQIWDRVRPELEHFGTIRQFRHKGKVAAMEFIWTNRERLLAEWIEAGRTVDWLQSLPWIGPITKWHLAKNLGVDCCKPDRHLSRLAESTGETPFALCKRLSRLTGDRIATVDVVLWRACNMGLIAANRMTQEVMF